jgi:hypothetical protein
MRVSNSVPLNGPEIQTPVTSAPSSRTSGSSHVGETTDEVSLSPVGASALSNRSDRVAELKTLVGSSDYTPSSADTSKKLVSEALSRSR